MLAGQFDSSGRPRVPAILHLPGLRFRAEVWLVVDTGAGRTTLTGRDLWAVRDQLRSLRQEILGSGFGGPVLGVRDVVLLTLRDREGWYTWQLSANLNPAEPELDSVLGP